jgi:hypothetical protein
VKRTLTLELGALGREALEEQAAAHGLSVAALLRHSALYYLSERDAGRLAWRVPEFARSAAGSDREGRLEVALEPTSGARSRPNRNASGWRSTSCSSTPRSS